MVLYFDYVDPGSYLLSHMLVDVDVRWLGFEIRAPPDPPVDPGESPWADYQADTAQFAEALGLEMNPPRLVPWTRKAHELTAQAQEQDCSEAMRGALFRAHFLEGLDIGRIDVLVSIADSLGMDPSETKAALDVDRWAAQVASDRALAQEDRIVGVPTLVMGTHRLEGLRSMHEIRDWIASHHTDTTKEPWRDINERRP
ncbi:MAG: DsbA family protein [Gemmatimonadota bacterium]|nr:DsbA family protein [Gemmatimonadota bacterium]